RSDAETALSTVNAQVSARPASISEAQATAEALQVQLAEAESTLAAQKTELDTAAATLAATKEQLDAQETELSSAKAQLDAATAQIEATEAELTAAEEELASAATQLEEGQAQLDASAAQIASAQTELNTQKQTLAAARTTLATTKTQLESSEAELEEAQAEVDAGYEELASAEAQLAEGRTELDDGWEQYYTARVEYESGLAEFEEGRAELEDAKAELEDARQEIADAEAEIAENEQTIADGWADYEEGKAEAEQEIADAEAEIADAEQEIADAEQEIADAEAEIADAEQEIADAEAEIADISYPSWYVYDRSSLPENTGYSENADRMNNIAQVFPVIFFLVAALISLTTMTRMVEEERTQIGTLKALGYGKWDIAKKYLKYAFWATICGSIFGVLFGEKLFPWVIISAYEIMYVYQPAILVPYNLEYGVIATGIALVCTVGAAFSACYRALGEVPAQLMRPPAPKDGKRVLLERVPFIWKHLNFNWKSTVRNLMRYKRRLLMTVLGIGGCMGLLLVGYGLRDSIGDIGALQFDELQTYDAMLIYDTDADEEEMEALEETVASDGRIGSWKRFYMQSMDIEGQDTSGTGKQWTTYIYVPEDTENISDYLTFRSRTSDEEYTLTDEGAIITEKIATEFGLSVGDSISIRRDTGDVVSIPIAAICENYLYHYVYLTPTLYEEVFGEAPEYNSIFFCLDESAGDADTEEGQEILEEIGTALLTCEAAVNITYIESLAETIDTMLSALDLVIIVLIVSAGLLAFVVQYNLNNININERRRELATLKVLGFFDGEVSMYIYRENIVNTILGAGAGALIGLVLHRFVILTVEVDSCMFGRSIYPMSYVYSILFTVAFSIIVNAAMHFKLKKIDMVESLKSIE
ncbi:MAG: FtsX-like permease family protein, partial [Lachnospiraceae bacterium]|nr:FtsX-like permease family protein [Lachnospiraceae bacterium]